jgi:hypothetical protein
MGRSDQVQEAKDGRIDKVTEFRCHLGNFGFFSNYFGRLSTTMPLMESEPMIRAYIAPIALGMDEDRPFRGVTYSGGEGPVDYKQRPAVDTPPWPFLELRQ